MCAYNLDVCLGTLGIWLRPKEEQSIIFSSSEQAHLSGQKKASRCSFLIPSLLEGLSSKFPSTVTRVGVRGDFQVEVTSTAITDSTVSMKLNFMMMDDLERVLLHSRGSGIRPETHGYCIITTKELFSCTYFWMVIGKLPEQEIVRKCSDSSCAVCVYCPRLWHFRTLVSIYLVSVNAKLYTVRTYTYVRLARVPAAAFTSSTVIFTMHTA